MDLNKTLDKINKDREKTEAAWVFCLWSEPDLFEDYRNVNEGKDKTLRNKDAIWYFNLGKALYKNGYRNFDAITLDSFLRDKPTVKKQYEEYGGWQTISELMGLINNKNTDGYFEEICKMNSLSTIATKYDEIFDDIDRFKNATNDDIYNTFDLLNNMVSTASNEKVEDLVITDGFLQGLVDGENMGFNYGKYAPLLNYITLGATPGLYMLGGHSGTGKSSFVYGNMLMSLHYAGVSTAIISNEMGIETYKVLLLEHILTQDLDYWGLTRKQIRMGKWDKEQTKMINKAKQISEEKYSDIKFVRLFNNSTAKITKYLRRLKAGGVGVVLLDTFKVDDSADLNAQIWASLLMDSRRLDNQCRKLDICCITTYQLALHTLNQRYLDSTCLSNAKQIKEVYENIVFFRPIWDDEFKDEKYDIHPWKYNIDNKKIKEEIELDRDKKYLLAFVDKTRSDEDKTVLVYEWLAHFNVWKELGFARVINEHRGF